MTHELNTSSMQACYVNTTCPDFIGGLKVHSRLPVSIILSTALVTERQNSNKSHTASDPKNPKAQKCRKNPKSIVTCDDASKYRPNAQLKYELVMQVWHITTKAKLNKTMVVTLPWRCNGRSNYCTSLVWKYFFRLLLAWHLPVSCSDWTEEG